MITKTSPTTVSLELTKAKLNLIIKSLHGELSSDERDDARELSEQLRESLFDELERSAFKEGDD